MYIYMRVDLLRNIMFLEGDIDVYVRKIDFPLPSPGRELNITLPHFLTVLRLHKCTLTDALVIILYSLYKLSEIKLMRN